MASGSLELRRGAAIHEIAASPSDARRASLFHPLVDLLCLGGASLIILPLIAWLVPAESARPGFAAFAFALSHFVNHPHFAHSYQIFYRNFAAKAFGREYGPALRIRYIVAGIVVPAALGAFFAGTVISGNAGQLGFGVNVMLFLVGWHYVKQGYGVAIVDSVLQRRFYADPEKRLLQLNAYACWLVAWAAANREVAAHDYWGLTYYTFAIPDAAWYGMAAVAGATTIATGAMLARKWRADRGAIAINGLVAYVTTLYVWVVFARLNPLFLLIIPAFHSLQYLLVVWRFQLNVEDGRTVAAESVGDVRRLPWAARCRFAAFVAIGLVLGFCGFWLAPSVLKIAVAYDTETFGATLYLFVFWIFINVHHYFLDNVLWRRENPETRDYLFAHR